MEIIVIDSSYVNDELSENEFRDSVETLINEFSTEYKSSDADIGRGADWPAFVFEFLGLFFLGEKIEKNLNSWINLAKRFHAFVQNFTKELSTILIDAKGAELLAINHIAKENRIDKLEKISESVTRIGESQWLGDSKLIRFPFSIFSFSFRVNDEWVYIIGINSNCNEEFVLRYRLKNYYL